MKIVDRTAIKFIFVGIINTLVGTSVMFGLYNLANMSYWFSSAANYVVGSIVSYYLNKYFTFNNKDKSKKQVFMFIINISVCYFLSYGLAKPLAMKVLSFADVYTQENLAMIFGMGLFVVFNYLGQRFVVFK